MVPVSVTLIQNIKVFWAVFTTKYFFYGLIPWSIEIVLTELESQGDFRDRESQTAF